MKRFLLFILVSSLGFLATFLVTSCRTPPGPAAQRNPSQSGYIDIEKPSGKPIAVVFVHGIFGSADETWTKSGANSLPRLLIQDSSLGYRLDAFVFEYYTPYLKDAAMIPQISEQLRGALDENHVFDKHQKVILVAHSMGGLVVRQFLIAHQEHVHQIPMLYFYATPTNGAEVTAAASILSKNPQLRDMLPLQGNSFLDAISNDWMGSSQLAAIPSFCAFETLPTGPIIIVSEQSARALCNRPVDPMSTNHIDIVKPRGANDPIYTHLSFAIESSLGSHSPVPNPTEQSRVLRFAGPFKVARMDDAVTFNLTKPVLASETANKTIVVKKIKVKATVSDESNEPFAFDAQVVVPPAASQSALNVTDYAQFNSLSTTYVQENSLVHVAMRTNANRSLHSSDPLSTAIDLRSSSVSLGELKSIRARPITTDAAGLKLQLFLWTLWGGQHSLTLSNVEVTLETVETPITPPSR